MAASRKIISLIWTLVIFLIIRYDIGFCDGNSNIIVKRDLDISSQVSSPETGDVLTSLPPSADFLQIVNNPSQGLTSSTDGNHNSSNIIPSSTPVVQEATTASLNLSSSAHSTALNDVNISTTTTTTTEDGQSYPTTRAPNPVTSNIASQPTVSENTLVDYFDRSHNQAVLHWPAGDSQVMMILTRQMISSYTGVSYSTVWRSTDYGETFENEAEKFPSDAVISNFYFHPTAQSLVILTDTINRDIYVSTDEGVSYGQYPVSFHPSSMIFHSTIDSFVLAYDEDNLNLYVSMNSGKSWAHIYSSVTGYAWSVPGVDEDEYIIHIEAIDSDTGLNEYTACTVPYCTKIIPDEQLGNIDHNSLTVDGNYIFIKKTVLTAEVLYVSYNRQAFKPAVFDKSYGDPLSYNIIHVNDGFVLVSAYYGDTVYHLFISDVTSLYFTVTIDNVAHGSTHVVSGFAGTILTNQRDTSTLQMRTWISFNNGKQWQLIEAPAFYRNNTSTNCQLPSCSLNLYTTSYSGFESEDSVPGVLIAYGQAHENLHSGSKELFISRDAGQTWSHLSDGQLRYTYANLAGIIMTVDKETEYSSSTINFTTDYGLSWTTSQFTDESIHVDGILNEANSTSTNIFIFGHIAQSSPWKVIKVNFSSVFDGPCTTNDFINTTFGSTSGEESDSDSGYCILGMERLFQHRNPDVSCYYTHDQTIDVFASICDCTDADYTCDFGYEDEDDEMSVCTPQDWFDENSPTTDDCPEGEFYNKSSGYKKVAGDICYENSGSIYDPIETACPIVTPDEMSIIIDSEFGGVYQWPTNHELNLLLNQDAGTKKSTVYTWMFGDDHEETITSYTNASYVTHTYNISGVYNVTVNASNYDGYNIVTQLFKIQDPIESVIFESRQITLAVNVGVTFSVTIPDYTNYSPGTVHYVWRFGDEESNELPLLTFNDSVRHTYTTAGQFIIDVRAVNDVSQGEASLLVQVYSDLRIIQLSFSSSVDDINPDTIEWQQYFATLLLIKITSVLGISEEIIQTYVNDGLPTVAIVTVLPNDEDDDDEDQFLNDIMSELIEAVENKKITITLPGNEEIQALTAVIIHGADPSDSDTENHNVKALYIVIPLVVICVIVIAIVLFVYRYRLYHISYLHMDEPDMAGSGSVVMQPSFRHQIFDNNCPSDSVIMTDEFIDDDFYCQQPIGEMPTLAVMDNRPAELKEIELDV